MHRDDATLIADTQIAGELGMSVEKIRLLIREGKLAATPIPQGNGYLIKWGDLRELAEGGKAAREQVSGTSLSQIEARLDAIAEYMEGSQRPARSRENTDTSSPLVSSKQHAHARRIHPYTRYMDGEAAEMLGLERHELKRLALQENCMIQHNQWGYTIEGREIEALARKYGRELAGLQALRGVKSEPVIYGCTPDQDTRNKQLLDSIETTTDREVQREMRAEAAQANNERQERDDKKRVPKWLR